MRICTLSVVATLVTSAWACLTTDTKWTNHTSKIVNVEPDNALIKHQVGGSVTILDGCRFYVRNMTLIPTGNAAYWWGISVHNNTDPYPRVVTAALGSYNGQGVTFHLDPQYSFDDISIMEIYGEGDSRVYGAFAISGNISQYFNVNDNDGFMDPTQPWSNSARGKTSGGPFVFWMFLLFILWMTISLPW